MSNQNNIHGGLRHGPSIAYTPKLKDNSINSSEPWNAKQSGSLSSTVVAETAYGQSSNAGTSVTVSKGDHTHGTPAAQSSGYTSSQQTITSGGALTLAHGLGSKPTMFQAMLVCQTAEQGYSIGDELVVSLGSIGTSTVDDKGFSLVPDATNLNIRYGSSGVVFVVNNKTTGSTVSLTNANWNVIFRAWLL